MSEPASRSSFGVPAPVRLLPVVAALLLFFAGLGSYPLLDPDEGRYTEIPREMLARHELVTPRLNGVLYFEKPPLYYWLNAGMATVFRRLETSARMAGALLGFAGLGLALALGRSMGSRRAGLLAAVFLATSPLYLALSRTATIDMTVTFFLNATLACFWLARERVEAGRSARLLWYGMFAAAALATLAKGLIGIVIPGAVVFLFLLAMRSWRLLLRIPWVSGVALFALIAVPWHVLAARRNPDFLWFYFVHEHWLRYTTPEADRQEPFWFFVPVLLLGLLPWSGLLPAAGRLFGRPLRERPAPVFLACWAGFVFLFFSASHSKLIPYMLPACLPLGLLAALGFETAGRRVRIGLAAGAVAVALLAAALAVAGLGEVPRYSPGVSPALLALSLAALAGALFSLWKAWRGPEGRALAALALAAALLLGAMLTTGERVSRHRSAKPFANYIQAHPGAEVYGYRYYPQSLPVYLGREIGVVAFRGELAFGIDHLPPAERARRYPTAEEFREVWRTRPVYLVLEKADLHRMTGDGLAPGPILLEQDKLLLMSNRPAA